MVSQRGEKQHLQPIKHRTIPAKTSKVEQEKAGNASMTKKTSTKRNVITEVKLRVDVKNKSNEPTKKSENMHSKSCVKKTDINEEKVIKSSSNDTEAEENQQAGTTKTTETVESSAAQEDKNDYSDIKNEDHPESENNKAILGSEEENSSPETKSDDVIEHVQKSESANEIQEESKDEADQDSKTTAEKEDEVPIENVDETNSDQDSKPTAEKEVEVPTENVDETNSSRKSPEQTEPAAENNTQEQENKTETEAEETAPSDIEDDVDAIKKALEGWNNDEQSLINILSARNNDQRQTMRVKYQERYNKNLIEVMKSELRGDFEEIVVALLMSPDEYDAYCLKDAMKGLGTDEALLNGILASKSPQKLSAIKKKYSDMYNNELIDDIKGDTSGDYLNLLQELVAGDRDQKDFIDEELAKDDAKKLYNEGTPLIKPDDDYFRKLLTCRSKKQLKKTFDEYGNVSGTTIEKAIEEVGTGDVGDAIITIVSVLRDEVVFYAERLHKAMDGAGTDDKTLIRIIVSRKEIDLPEIKKTFLELYGKSLEEWIETECSGDYKKLLLAVVRSDK